MNRLMVVAVVGVMSLGGAAHGESVAMKKAVDSCVAETMSYQPEGMSDKDVSVLEARVSQECKLIVQRECEDTSRPLCQHFSGMKLTDFEQQVSHNQLRPRYPH